MNELRIFENPEFGSVRTVTIDEDVWFIGNDVAKALDTKMVVEILAGTLMKKTEWNILSTMVFKQEK